MMGTLMRQAIDHSEAPSRRAASYRDGGIARIEAYMISIYLVGLAVFAIASLLGGLASSIGWLVAARALQGVGAALLVPGSLALIQAAFHPDDRARAVGAWSGMSGVAGAAGPLLGGASARRRGGRCRGVALGVLDQRPDSRLGGGAGDPSRSRYARCGGARPLRRGRGGAGGDRPWRPDVQPHRSLRRLGDRRGRRRDRHARHSRLRTGRAACGGADAAAGAVSVREFSAANLASFCLYGAVAGMFFLLPMQLQITTGYSPLAAGLALLPITAVVLVLSSHMGALVTRVGSRIPLTAGSVVCAAGALLAVRIGPHASYVAYVLPVVVAAGLGISAITAPISVTVQSAVPDSRAGIARRRQQWSGPRGWAAAGRGRTAAVGEPAAERRPESGNPEPRVSRQHADLRRAVPTRCHGGLVRDRAARPARRISPPSALHPRRPNAGPATVRLPFAWYP
ncbi:MAG: MFS transporter [Streptosporangiales bacterium]|nr:MFS transporter [Streptosporangiales bacterium]